jgi:hypothetical protein
LEEGLPSQSKVSVVQDSGSGFRVQGLGFRVGDLDFRSWGFGSAQGSGLRMQGLGKRV